MRNSSRRILVSLLGCAAMHAAAAQSLPHPEGYDRIFALVDAGEFEAAYSLADSLRSAFVQRYGENSVEYGFALHGWAVARLERGDGAADEVLAAAERAAELCADSDNPIRGSVLHTLGAVHTALGDAAAAALAYERALDAQRDVAPVVDRARTINSLAIALATQGKLAEAEPRFVESLALWEQELGAEHPDVGKGYSNLATLYRILGRFDESIEHADRAIAIFRSLYGEAHPSIAAAVSVRGAVYMSVGRLREAREDYELALSMRPEEGPNAWHRAYDYSGLGLVEMQMGLYEDALAHHEQARALFAEGVGPDHDLVSYPLSNLAWCALQLNRLGEAVEFAERSAAIIAMRAGNSSPRYASASSLLGYIVTQSGQPRIAVPRLREAVATLDSIYGEAHQDVVDARRFLAVALQRSGELEGALDVVDAAIRGGEQLPRAGHNLASSLAVRGNIRLQMADGSGALEDGLRAEQLSRDDYRTIVQSLSERAGAEFARARADGLRIALSALVEGAWEDPEAVSRVWDALVRSRSLLLDELIERRRVVAGSDDPGLASLADEVVAARSTLAAYVVRGIEGDADAYLATLESARKRKDAAEAALAERSVVFRERIESRDIGLDDCISALGAGQGLIALTRFERLVGAGEYADHYVAFVQSPNARHFVDLGDAEAIDPLLERWRTTVADGRAAAGPLAATILEANRAAGLALRKAVLDPALAVIGNASLVYLVLDGPLHLLNPAALPDGEDGWLVESGMGFHLLGAERGLVTSQALDGSEGLLAVGAPEFDRRASLQLVASEGSILRGLPRSCARFRERRFAPLQGARAECLELQALWESRGRGDAKVLLGSDATESSLTRAAGGQSILHVATHAYVLDASCIATEEGRVAADPLLLSGLALGGANLRDESQGAYDDGILTAEEIALLDLEGTGWVVLSGCDTGLGEIVPGEGVHGLRRAFRGAGARTVIMSLWPVDDAATAAWMNGLYRARLQDGASTPSAVAAASRAVLRERRAAGLSEHPFWWAGFVAVGDPD